MRSTLVLVVAGATLIAATDQTRIRVDLCKKTPSKIEDWVVHAPETTAPNTPRFDFSLSSAALQPIGQLRWSACLLYTSPSPRDS